MVHGSVITSFRIDLRAGNDTVPIEGGEGRKGAGNGGGKAMKEMWKVGVKECWVMIVVKEEGQEMVVSAEEKKMKRFLFTRQLKIKPHS